MSARWLRLAALCALVVHGYFSYVSWAEYGYAGAFPPFAQSNTTQIFSDLLIALVGVNIWVFLDMSELGIRRGWFVLHAIGTALVGSFAPLLYVLLRRPMR